MTKAEPKTEASAEPTIVRSIEEHPLVIALRAEIMALRERQVEEISRLQAQYAADLRAKSLEFTTRELELQDRVIELQNRLIKFQQSKLFQR